MTLEEARTELHDSARAFSERGGSDTRLIVAAIAYAKLIRQTADGIPAAKHRVALDAKRGKQLCPSCVTDILPAKDKDGRTSWVDAKTMQPHRCPR